MRRLLIDAGILIRIAYEHDPLSRRALYRVRELTREGWDPCFGTQAVREAMNALTRPVEIGGYGLQSEPALESLRRLETSFTLLPDNADVFRHWQGLVAKHAIVGKSAHDANVVAAALAHGATHLLTLNERDFRRYDEITVLTV